MCFVSWHGPCGSLSLLFRAALSLLHLLQLFLFGTSSFSTFFSVDALSESSALVHWSSLIFLVNFSRLRACAWFDCGCVGGLVSYSSDFLLVYDMQTIKTAAHLFSTKSTRIWLSYSLLKLNCLRYQVKRSMHHSSLFSQILNSDLLTN